MSLPPSSSYTSRQPLEMLAEQTRLLNEINSHLMALHEAQSAQQKQIETIRQELAYSNAPEQKVSLTKLDISFMNMANFMVKWSLATTPAGIALAILFGACYLILYLIGIGPGHSMGGLP